MNRLIILSLILNIIMAIPTLATTINIPADFPTIQEGIDASSNGDTVLVQPGTYVENIYIEEQTVFLASLYLTTGDSSYIDQTIIDGDSVEAVVTYYYQNQYDEGISALIGFTIQNGYGHYGGGISCRASDPIIDHNIITGNSSSWAGGGIFCWTSSNPTISNNKIFNNSAVEEGGGLWIVWSHSTVKNNHIYSNRASSGGGAVFSVCGSNEETSFSHNLITNNEADVVGSGILVRSSTFTIINSTIADNNSNLGVCVDREGSLTLLNTIVWDNDLPPILIDTGSCISITYSDIEDGWSEDTITNIDIDPLFRDPENGDFHLMGTYCGDPYDSPCIDMGKPTILDSLLDCDWGLGAERSDMGAYSGGGGTVDIYEPITQLPLKTSLSQNYPNPFNAKTTIAYNLPFASNAKLDIYDLLGHHIETVSNGYQSAGHYQVTWNANELSSGVYFYKLTASDFSETKKMFLVK